MKNCYLLMALWLGCGSTNATAEHQSPLRGESFSAPETTAAMPNGWETTPVKYTQDIKDADLVISLGQQTYPALREVVEEYARANHLKIVIQHGTCGTSAGKLLHKTIDLGDFCCPPNSNDRLPGLEFHTVGISSVAIFTNIKNPVDNLSTEEARKVFQGKFLNWEDVRSKTGLNKEFNRPIKTVARLHCKSRPGHWTLLLKDQELFSPTLQEVGVIPDLVAQVGQEDNAVSIETPLMVKMYSDKHPVKMLKINGHAPTETEYVATGHYPFYRTYSMTTWNLNAKQRAMTLKLIEHLRDYIEINYKSIDFVPVSMLKKAGWKFKADELIGEPDGTALIQIPMQ